MTEIEEILKLSPAEKILLIEKIWESVPHEAINVTESQRSEMKERLERYQTGKTKFYTWDQIKKELRG